MTARGILIACLLLMPGCAVVDVGVSNPMPELSRVAVVPFFNLSSEPAADGHRFADAYFAELQKVPGFQVLPVGVAEAAIQDHQLNMQNPHDAVKLCGLLGVDAVVVGAITDYTPYYPPRVGWQVSWYTAIPWEFVPGIPTEPSARNAHIQADSIEPCKPDGFWKRLKYHAARPFRWAARYYRRKHTSNSVLFRGQSPPEFPQRQLVEDWDDDFGPLEPPRPLVVPDPVEARPLDNSANGMPAASPLKQVAVPIEPIMSYTRLFDGSDSKLTATFRDYMELRDDLRSGGWKASLYRTEDFLRFTAHRMIVEMLSLHGGETRQRAVFLHRRER